MVFGPLMDALKAQREGKDVVHVILEGNRLVSTRLSHTAKLIFWLTNVPYFLLSAELATIDSSALVASAAVPKLHALAILGVAVVSTAYHGAQVYGDAHNPWSARLLAVDIFAANGYAMVLAYFVGILRMLQLFLIPLLFLATGARLKRRAMPYGFAWGHGIWHVLTAAAMRQALLRRS